MDDKRSYNSSMTCVCDCAAGDWRKKQVSDQWPRCSAHVRRQSLLYVCQCSCAMFRPAGRNRSPAMSNSQLSESNGKSEYPPTSVLLYAQAGAELVPLCLPQRQQSPLSYHARPHHQGAHLSFLYITMHPQSNLMIPDNDLCGKVLLNDQILR